MASGAIGTVTRGTTNTNRLRRVDRWVAAQPVLRRTSDPLVVDLGYGASGVTALELHQRLALSLIHISEPTRLNGESRFPCGG